MPILNIAGYKFITLNELESLRQTLLKLSEVHGVKGTILLSEEGININLAGDEPSVRAFLSHLQKDSAFSDMRFHETYSTNVPFKVMKVKIKNEIITMRQPSANPTAERRAPAISPAEFKQWLDENRDLTLLDTRNDYEYRFGTFKGAINLRINHFGELPTALTSLDKTKTVVMFCTGGVRCEKAALYMQEAGFSDVYQLDSGIIGYFAKVGGAHFEGECFVFDDRIAIHPNLKNASTAQCGQCSGPIKLAEQQAKHYLEGKLCGICA